MELLSNGSKKDFGRCEWPSGSILIVVRGPHDKSIDTQIHTHVEFTYLFCKTHINMLPKLGCFKSIFALSQ